LRTIRTWHDVEGRLMIDDPVLVDDWHPVARLEDVPATKPLAVRLLGEDVVLWRAAGSVLAWQDLCVHRGTRLSLGRVDGEAIECPYHGWTYGTDGRCIAIPAHPGQVPPAKASVKTYLTRVRYGLVWVSLGSPAADIWPFPEWEATGYRTMICGPYPVDASGPRIVENFLDVGHFPFVHENMLGTRDRPEVEEYEAEIGPDGVVARSVRVYQPDPYGTGQGALVEYTYRAPRPLTAYLAKESAGPRFSLLLAVTPHEEVRSTAWMVMAMNYGHEIPERELIAWQDTIFAQDQPILESQRPELLPLDLQAELHLRSDRAAIAYRAWLRELGVSFGTA
jgi:phenylpropionate dioxygenase-like ring-hydroxylating dioxygenase large terminal subunit